jgi:ubiquinone/menaquinone biosynthesis C-methylase UbiE
MNEAHLKYCSSDEWAEGLKRYMIPGALDGVDLGDNVLEVGPGPGRTTELIRTRTARLTAVEIDPMLAEALRERMKDTNVTVIEGDATALPFGDAEFSGACSFTMMHHVPSIELQDRLFAEVRRVLRPGAVLAGVDSLDSPDFRALHVDDICVPLDPATLAGRLERAGFSEVRVEPNPYVLQWWAKA